jgi:hypothetical protein
VTLFFIYIKIILFIFDDKIGRMKRITVAFFGFIFLTISTNVSSQSYTSFPEDSAVWTVQYGKPNFFGHDNVYYTIIDDTLINNVSYNKLYSYGYYNRPNPYKYRGAYRNDIEKKKVYFVKPDSSKEHILYDFDLKIGDTTHIEYL